MIKEPTEQEVEMVATAIRAAGGLMVPMFTAPPLAKAPDGQIHFTITAQETEDRFQEQARKMARAALSAMSSGWRPIEEAPESTRVLGEFCAGRWKPDSGPYRTALDARIDPSVRCVHVLFHMGRFEGERAICTSYYEFPSPVVIHSLPEPKP